MIDKPATILFQRGYANEFKIDQIVCLELDNSYLFAEVIDNIAISARCWVRPLALARLHPVGYANDSHSFELEFLHDLRDASQLILPAVLFRYALDTEVLPLISELFHPEKDSTLTLTAKQALHKFIADIYQSPS
jgi:hypothetical protein